MRRLNADVNEDKRPPPHLFQVAEEAYQQVMLKQIDQVVIISGESGAGKTEATKILLGYLTNVNKDFRRFKVDFSIPYEQRDITANLRAMISKVERDDSIEAKILRANPLLEAFGNAATLRNKNSSRFGKFIKLHMTRYG